PDAFARARQLFEIVAWSPVRQERGRSNFLGRGMHEAEPPGGKGAMLLNQRQVFPPSCVFKEEPIGSLVLRLNRPIIIESTYRQVWEDLFIDSAFRQRRSPA